MSRRFNKRLLCCFRLTTSHTEGREVNKEKNTSKTRDSVDATLSFFSLSNPRSVQSQGCRRVGCVAVCLPHHSRAAVGHSSKSKARLLGGQRGAPLSPPAHMHNGKAANCRSTWALCSPPRVASNLRKSRPSLCRTCLPSALSAREQQRRPQTLYKPPPHRRGRTMVWSKHGGIRVKISSTAERSS